MSRMFTCALLALLVCFVGAASGDSIPFCNSSKSDTIIRGEPVGMDSTSCLTVAAKVVLSSALQTKYAMSDSLSVGAPSSDKNKRAGYTLRLLTYTKNSNPNTDSTRNVTVWGIAFYSGAIGRKSFTVEWTTEVDTILPTKFSRIDSVTAMRYEAGDSFQMLAYSEPPHVTVATTLARWRGVPNTYVGTSCGTVLPRQVGYFWSPFGGVGYGVMKGVTRPGEFLVPGATTAGTFDARTLMLTDSGCVVGRAMQYGKAGATIKCLWMYENLRGDTLGR
jgi:hypothetical protein